MIHFECSAFSGDNVDEIFTSLSKHLMNKIESGIIEPSSVISTYASSVRNLIVDKKKDDTKENEQGMKCAGNC